MNYYPHHIGDYLTATAHLTMLEDGAYRRLLDLYYSREEPIVADVGRACRLVRAVSDEDRQSVQTVLEEFFTLTEAGWEHRRCEEEINKAAEAAERSRKNGRKGGRPRDGKPDNDQEETQQVISGLSAGIPEETHQQPGGKAPNTNTNTNTNKPPLPPTRGRETKRFQPPSVEQVAEYISQHEYPVDPQEFIDHYTANGWVQGKGKPIKDWQAAVRTWANKRKNEQPKIARLVIPEGSGVDVRSALWKLCQEAGIPAEEVNGHSLHHIRDLIRKRHPGGDASGRGFRLIQGGVAA